MAVRGGWTRIVPFALVLVLLASVVLAGTTATVDPPTPANDRIRGVPIVRLDSNCYFPEDAVTITLRNIGAGRLLYDYRPEFEIDHAELGTVRMILQWIPMDFILNPGKTFDMFWDQRWRAVDENGDPIHFLEFVPEGEYVATVKAVLNETVLTLGRVPFVIGACHVQVGAGDDVAVDEGTPFRLAPDINLTGSANITSVTWDTDLKFDGNGDGNPANDADLIGADPELVYYDDGAYTLGLNVRGFLPNESQGGVKQDVVFAIDSSGSMEWNDPLGLRKEAAKAYVDMLVPDDRAAVVDFDSRARLVGDDHLSTNYGKVKFNIDRIDSFGGTFLARGLETAIDELQGFGDPNHTYVVIFLTDAESIFEDDTILIPEQVWRAQKLGVRIYTVGLNVPFGLEDLMRSIANDTGGRYFPAPTADALHEIYEEIATEVRKQRGTFFLAQDTLVVTVNNVAPNITAEIEAGRAVNVTLRVAGEKWHDVTLVLTRNGTEVGNASVVRVPGSPDEQAVSLGPLEVDPGVGYAARVTYTPEDDPVNGQPNGATPAWLIFALDNGTEVRLHHTFNVMHPETWVWDVEGLEALAGAGGSVDTAVTITDRGSDDLAVTIDWGDGTVETHFFLYDPSGPDPFPSPEGGSATVSFTATHSYPTSGTYVITITATDDDGGQTTLVLPLATP